VRSLPILPDQDRHQQPISLPWSTSFLNKTLQSPSAFLMRGKGFFSHQGRSEDIFILS
jgi:hypothetical protein